MIQTKLRSKALIWSLPFKEKYFIHSSFIPLQPIYLLDQFTAADRMLFIRTHKFQLKPARSTSVPNSTSYRSTSWSHRDQKPQLHCRTSKWRISIAATSTAGWNLINTSLALVILTASYTHKPHNFSILMHLSVTSDALLTVFKDSI